MVDKKTGYTIALLQPYKGLSMGIDKTLYAEMYTDKRKKTHGELDSHNTSKSFSKFQMLVPVPFGKEKVKN